MSDESEDTPEIPVATEPKLPSRKEAIATLWKKGVLWYKLNDSQKDLYDLVVSAKRRKLVFLCSRRFGKSFVLCLIAIEKCIREKNVIVKYLCPDAKQAKNAILPIIREILDDCPKNLRPEYLKNEGKYVFPNGSEIQIAANDNGRAESLRGGLAHLCIVDEAGFCDNLRYNVDSILFPTVSTTGGKIILSSTPPTTAGHEFVDYVNDAKKDGTFIKKTLFENPRFNPAQAQEIIDNYKKGIEDPEFRREYMCDLSIDTDDRIIPEFNDALEKEIVKEWSRPAFFDFYEALDIGYEDFTAALFGYYDFKADKIVIEDEFIINRMTTTALAEGIKRKENTLLYDPVTNDHRLPYLRISDTNLIVINDLYRLHGLRFLPTAKDDKESAVNNTRIMMNAGKIIIHPRCVTLISHLRKGRWKKAAAGRTRAFDREEGQGHFDTLDALIYLVRNIQFSRNPYPKDWGTGSRENKFEYQNNKPVNVEYQKMSNWFKPKKSLPTK